MIADSACINSERSLGAKEGTMDWSEAADGFESLTGSYLAALTRVPAELPAGPLPIGPNDPTATRALRRSPGGAPHPATSPAVAVARRRCRPLSLAGRWSNPAGRRIPAGRGSATGWSVDRWWTRGRRCRLGTFWLV